MSNKLYEENSIADIANAIRQINGETETYTVAEMGEAIRATNRKVYKGTITETVVGSNKYAVLAKDSFLAEHRAEENLFVRVKFDVEQQAYTIVETWCCGEQNKGLLVGGLQAYQAIRRYDGSAALNTAQITVPVTSETSQGVGCVLITEDGELRIYSNSSVNYTIRPSAYTVIVEC